MTITEISKDGAKVLRLSGRFDFHARHEFNLAVQRMTQGPIRHLVLNLQGVPFMDSAALGMLSIMHEQLTARHIRVSIAGPQEYVKKVLHLAKMDRDFSIHATEEQAISSPALAL